MSQNIPLPPPPLPLKVASHDCFINISSETFSHLNSKSVSHSEPDAEQEFVDTRNRLWALEGWKEPPLLTVYQYLPPILQEGPQ